ncbi:MAG: hypothetical protein JSV87_00350 [Candidatus Bathyarchaeota archaeon]|nr:MAG: hypothetical protein JSW29_05990 [Candidatus Bathyarchaeota archaeon]UCD40038.1 MAG: hypothetical protein JSV87_00350 [Candidatus Bathyarchaeota archaeon]
MSKKATLYEDVDGTTFEVGLPLTSNVDLEGITKELGVPTYVDMGYFPMKCAAVSIWAALNASQLHERYPEAFEKRVSKKPIPVLLFGGGAVKMHCEHANGTGVLSRAIKDTDFIVPKKHGLDFYRLLLSMDKAFGTRYKSFSTKSDRLFNALRHGDRYRVRTIEGSTDEGVPVVGVMDVLCDHINLRHNIEIKDAFKKHRENLYTIGLEYLILTKVQFITDFPKEKVERLKDYEQEFRILSYPYYKGDSVVLGMEEKDVKDVCAIFLGHSIGEGKEEIDPKKMMRVLRKDQKFALTATLNLENLAEKPDVLKRWLRGTDASTVTDRIKTLLQRLPAVDKKWDRPWWNTAVETPIIE